MRKTRHLKTIISILLFGFGITRVESAPAVTCRDLFVSKATLLSTLSNAEVRRNRVEAILKPSMARKLSATDPEIVKFYESTRSDDFNTLPVEAIDFRHAGGMFVGNLRGNRSLLVQFRDAKRESNGFADQVFDMAVRVDTAESHVLDVMLAAPFRDARTYLFVKMGHGNMPLGSERKILEDEIKPLKDAMEKVREEFQSPEMLESTRVGHVTTYSWENPTRMGYTASYLFARFVIVFKSKKRPTPAQIETILNMIESHAETAP